MIKTLPPWVEAGAFLLALVAGWVNAIGLLGFAHQSISHLSGLATLLGSGVVNEPFSDLLHLMAIMLSFLFGATFSGIALSGSSLALRRRYDLLLWVEAALLVVSAVLLNGNASLGHYTASAACGLQNALATQFSGAVVRTTHVTGIFTDLGLMLGAWLRGEAFDKRKAVLFIAIIVGFITGGGLGALSYAHVGFWALLVPAMLCVLLAIAYWRYRHCTLRDA